MNNSHKYYNPGLEWLDLVQPVGLVVSRNLLDDLGVLALPQNKADTAEVAAFIEQDPDLPALADPLGFVQSILKWPLQVLAGTQGGPDLAGLFSVALPEHETTLAPTWALSKDKDWKQQAQLLVQLVGSGVNPDQRGAIDGWEATAHQRFERLLRESGVCIGVMFCDHEIRFVYAPRGETSGWLSFPLRPLATVAGRPILGGLKLLLGMRCLFMNTAAKRLPALLQESRKAQANVSIELSKQVLGALHELLRGAYAADPALIGQLSEKRAHHLYEGLLSVLMRLVFILFAEDRDLLPSQTDKEARELYKTGYSVRGLFGKLLDDEALYPDTMDERIGGWGRLLALFRLVHDGHPSGWIRGRGGKLFNPESFLFLEGRLNKEAKSVVLNISDGCLLRILRGLMMLKGERLSYRTLDVEQIGSVYETVMGFTVEQAKGDVLAIKAGKNNKVPVFINLDALLEAKDAAKLIKETADRAVTAKLKKELNQASSIEDLAAALSSIVDERGSPHQQKAAKGTPILQPTDERRRTGSHYTPRSLTEPIVRHALAPAFEALGADATPEQVLALKVCDPACGSGAFLVEACRAISQVLTKSWLRWPEQKPEIAADEDEELHARRLVAQRCLYGVDKNPMATDLARLALWLATLARDHEFTFLDHALKTGDSLVGLSNKQIAAANWDDKAVGLALFQQLVKERTERALACRREIRNADNDVTRAIQAEREKIVNQRLEHVRLVGDAVIAAFFAGKKKKDREEERVKIEECLLSPENQAHWDRLERMAATLNTGDHPIKPFHWQLEFPEVFAGKNAGFDAIIGNPPFAGKNTIAAGSRKGILDWFKTLHAGAHGNSDLVAHFYRRAFGLIRKDGVFGLIATNTIGQGDTRATGLTHTLQNGGNISHALRRLQWPGEAAVVVSVVHIKKGVVSKPLLDERPVSRISAYLVEGDLDVSPVSLKENAGKAFVGSYLLGMGFTFDDKAAAKGTALSLADREQLIKKNPNNEERIFPYIGGEEVNNEAQHLHYRYAIDFFDRPLKRDIDLEPWFKLSGSEQSSCLVKGIVPDDYQGECAEDWPDLLEIVQRLVKPDRDKQKRKALRERWWQYAEKRPGLYAAIANLPQVLALSRVSPQLGIAQLEAGKIYAESMIIFAFSNLSPLTILQSRVHEIWARFFSSTLEDRLRYAPSDCFATFPFPENFETNAALEAAGQAYHDHRAALMLTRGEGMTKTYNRFHKATEQAEDIETLRQLHAAMDQAVLRAYGWDDLAKEAHSEFHTPEMKTEYAYQKSFFWLGDFRDEVLKRLLSLNAERAKAQG